MTQTTTQESIQIWWYGEWIHYKLFDKKDQEHKAWYGNSFPRIISFFIGTHEEFKLFLKIPTEDHLKKETLTDHDKEQYPEASYKILNVVKNQLARYFLDSLKTHSLKKYNELMEAAQTKLDETLTGGS